MIGVQHINCILFSKILILSSIINQKSRAYFILYSLQHKYQTTIYLSKPPLRNAI